MTLSISEIKKKLVSYKLEIFLTVCLFSNLYPDLPSWGYYIILLVMFILAQQYGSGKGKRAKLAIGMLVVVVFSSTVNLTLTLRVAQFALVFIGTLMFSSFKFYRFKVRMLRCFMWGFALTAPINYYAHVKGINYQLYNWRHLGETFTLDFSGFTVHPMWLSAACAIATIFFVYQMILIWQRKGVIWSLMMLPLIYVSVMVTIWGASRSALGISVGAALLLVYLINQNLTRAFGIVAFIAVISVFLMPKFVEGATRMQNKKEVKSLTDNSRGSLWMARVEEFTTSPLWGIGFSATGIGAEKQVGRAETGSGWLSILSQAGLLGLILAILLVKRAILPLRYLRENKEIALYYALFIFMSLHTLFEAYVFQGGWYLCFVYWLTVSVLDDYRKYLKYSIE